MLALRAIFDSFQNGTRPSFQGKYYAYTLMTPFFDPGPNPYGVPKVFLAAVGEKTCARGGTSDPSRTSMRTKAALHIWTTGSAR